MLLNFYPNHLRLYHRRRLLSSLPFPPKMQVTGKWSVNYLKCSFSLPISQILPKWYDRCCKTAAWFTGHTEWVILGGLLLLLVQPFLFRKSLKVADQQRSSNIRQFTGAIKTSSINHKVISKQCDMAAAAAESDCRQTVVAAHFIFQSVVKRKECLASLFLPPLICRHHNGTHSCRQRHRQKER